MSDNAASPEQAGPLRPADGRTAAIVTSRHRLGMLNTRKVDIGVLPAEDAVTLLRRAMAMLDPLANAVGDPDLKDKVTSLLQSNPAMLGYFTIGISVITIAARLRSIAKGA